MADVEKENLMLSLFLTILVLIIVFYLAYYLIGLIPFPPPLANIKWVFYAILIIIAIIVLLRFIPGVNLNL
jgi:hypothetical protein